MQGMPLMQQINLQDIIQTEPVSTPPEELPYGYWQAADSQWYPPELHATYVPFVSSLSSTPLQEESNVADKKLTDDFTYFLGKELAPRVEVKQQSLQHDPLVSAVGRWGIYESAYLLIGLGGALLASSAFLPWFMARGTTPVSLYAVLRLVGHDNQIAQWFMIIVGAVCIVAALAAWRSVRLARLAVLSSVVLLGDILYGSWLYYRALDAPPHTVFVGDGFIIVLASITMLLVGAFFIYRKRQRLQHSYALDVLKQHLLDI